MFFGHHPSSPPGLGLRTYPWPKICGVLAVTAVVVWGSIQLLHVPLCSYALNCMARRAESCVTHLRATVLAVSGPVLTLWALCRAPTGTLTWTIHPDTPWLHAIPLRAPHQSSPSAGWLAGVRKNSKPQQLQAASVIISSSGAASLFLHLPGQLCMSME